MPKSKIWQNMAKIGIFLPPKGDRINRSRRSLARKRRPRVCYSTPNLALMSKRVSVQEPPKMSKFSQNVEFGHRKPTQWTHADEVTLNLQLMFTIFVIKLSVKSLLTAATFLWQAEIISKVSLQWDETNMYTGIKCQHFNVVANSKTARHTNVTKQAIIEQYDARYTTLSVGGWAVTLGTPCYTRRSISRKLVYQLDKW